MYADTIKMPSSILASLKSGTQQHFFGTTMLNFHCIYFADTSELQHLSNVTAPSSSPKSEILGASLPRATDSWFNMDCARLGTPPRPVLPLLPFNPLILIRFFCSQFSELLNLNGRQEERRLTATSD